MSDADTIHELRKELQNSFAISQAIFHNLLNEAARDNQDKPDVLAVLAWLKDSLPKGAKE